MSARSVCSGKRPCRYHSERAISLPFRRPRHADLDALAAEAQRRIDRLAHGAPEADALFQLQRDRFRHQLRVEFRLVHFLNVDMDFAARRFCSSCLSLSISAPLRPMMMPGRAVRMMMRSLLPGRSISTELTPADFSLSFSSFFSLYVFEQQLVVVPLDKPARLPRLGVAEAESVWMNLSVPSCVTPKNFSMPVVGRWSMVVCQSIPERLTTIDQRQSYFFAVAFLPAAFFLAGALALRLCLGFWLRRPLVSPFSRRALLPMCPRARRSYPSPPAQFPDAQCAARNGRRVPWAQGRIRFMRGPSFATACFTYRLSRSTSKPFSVLRKFALSIADCNSFRPSPPRASW
jgi:hypothetical protein